MHVGMCSKRIEAKVVSTRAISRRAFREFTLTILSSINKTFIRRIFKISHSQSSLQ